MQETFGPFDWNTLPDGTYLKTDPDTVINYAARWDYGYIVAVEPIDTFRSEHRSHLGAVTDDYVRVGQLFGVWEDSRTGHIYVDIVQHVDALSDALELASAHNQLAIWDVRHKREIRVEGN